MVETLTIKETKVYQAIEELLADANYSIDDKILCLRSIVSVATYEMQNLEIAKFDMKHNC